MDGRAEHRARNEALLREVNEQIHKVGERLQVLPDDERIEFHCECGRPECDSSISMTAAEYEHVRSDDDSFALVPGHEDPEIERVVERKDGYVIVDKRPEFEPYVEGGG